MIRKILATNESVLVDSVDNVEPFRLLTGANLWAVHWAGAYKSSFLTLA
jgi:hypothetical protein